MVLGDAVSGNHNPGRRRGGKVDRRSVGDESKGEEERGIGEVEERERGEKRRRGGVLGDAGSGNPGRRPRVPASTINTPFDD